MCSNAVIRVMKINIPVQYTYIDICIYTYILVHKGLHAQILQKDVVIKMDHKL